MSTGVVAASAAAVAMYWYLFKQKNLQDGVMEPVFPVEACRNAPDHAPSNWGEALFHVKEVLKYMYNETLGRWHTIDLFVGLAYLSHREAIDYPAADIAAKGTPVVLDCGITNQIKIMLELQEARRYMLYCKGLKLRREEMQARFWREHLGAGQEETFTVVKQQATAGVLRPAYVVISDHSLRCVVLCIRGTHSMKDLFTSLAGASKPHHVVDPDSGRLVLGYSHLGMLAAARWLARQVTPVLRTALESCPGYQLRIVGHSMGGGTAALLTMIFRGGLPSSGTLSPTPTLATSGLGIAPGSAAPVIATTSAGVPVPGGSMSADPFLSARCVAIACPSVVTLELAAACRDYVTSIVNGTDIVPTFCAASVDRLREDVTRSSWFSEFSRDMRMGVLRAVQGGVRGVGTATQWTSRILQPAVVPFRACYATTANRRARKRAASVSQSALTAVVAVAGPSTSRGVTSSTLAATTSSGELMQMSAAEPREQLLLAAGAGDGAIAAVRRRYAADVGSSAGALLPELEQSAVVQQGGSALPPMMQSMSPGGERQQGGAVGAVDQRAMAEAVQSCMYAVNSSVSAHHHHDNHHEQQQLQRRPSDPALAEVLGLMESLPQELGPPPVAAPSGTGRTAGSVPPARLTSPHRLNLEGMDAVELWRRWGGTSNASAAPCSGSSLEADIQEGDSLLLRSAPVSLGSGGMSTAMMYGSNLRRRLWPWGHIQCQDGVSGSRGNSGDGAALPVAGSPTGALPSVAVAGGGTMAPLGIAVTATSKSTSYGSMCEQESGGNAVIRNRTLLRMSAPDSPGKDKAAAASVVAAVGPGTGRTAVGGGIAALASTRAIGDWLWRGMMFTSCIAPRRTASVGAAGLGAAARGSAVCGRAGASISVGAGGGGPLLIDVGDGFDDESDTDMDSEGVETGEGRQGLQRRATACGGGNVHGLEEGVDEATSDSSGRYEGDGEEEEEEEVEQEGAFGGGGGDGGGGVSLADPTSIDNEQQLQAGITAVVAAVTNQASREAAEGPQALLHDENTLAAEDVLREIREADAAAAAASALGRSEGLAADGGRTTTCRRPVGSGDGDSGNRNDTLRRREPRGRGDRGADGEQPVAAMAVIDEPRLHARTASDAVIKRSDDAEEDEEPPLSPDGITLYSPTGGGGQAGLSTADYEARLYKRRLYPAGRILHLFSGAALLGSPESTTMATAQNGAAATAAVGAAGACTTPADVAAARICAARAPYILYEVSDPQAYSRVRLCRTMVSDHLIPAYLAALDSVLSQLEDKQQRAAMDAWDLELEREGRQQAQQQRREERLQGSGSWAAEVASIHSEHPS